MVITMDNLLLILYSFGLSFFLGFSFQIEKKYLFWVGLSGAITRIALIGFSTVTPLRFVYTFLAAVCCSIYAHFMGRKMHVPYTCFLCPAMLPLIPGDLITNLVVAIFSTEKNIAAENFYELVLALMGISLGFVFIGMIVHYRNAYSLKQLKAALTERKKKEAM